MLIERCPNLEHLAIDGHSPHAPVSAQGLFQGRWPKLRTLLIGDIVFDWHQIGALDKPFSAFLNAHRNLDALHLHSHAPSVAAPAMLTDLHVDALANLRTFSGALGQAQALPARTRAALKSLRVHDALVLREGTPLSIGGALAALPTLTSLSITFRLEHGYENGSVLRAIVGACPYLRHLDLTVTCRPSLTLVRLCPTPLLFGPNTIPPLGHFLAIYTPTRTSPHTCSSYRTFTRRSTPPHMRNAPSTRKPSFILLRTRLPRTRRRCAPRPARTCVFRPRSRLPWSPACVARRRTPQAPSLLDGRGCKSCDA
jgi:hypothetical protein